jgi:hypothetical protein
MHYSYDASPRIEGNQGKDANLLRMKVDEEGQRPANCFVLEIALGASARDTSL